MSFPNNFKFTFIFSVFLVAVLAFVGRPAMATVSVTAQVTEVVGASTGPPAVQGKKVVTIKYSENADPSRHWMILQLMVLKNSLMLWQPMQIHSRLV